MPIEYYYVDVSAGGYGLTSFEKQYHASTVGNWVQFMNKSRTNMAGRVIEASVALHKRTHAISQQEPFHATSDSTTHALYASRQVPALSAHTRAMHAHQ